MLQHNIVAHHSIRPSLLFFSQMQSLLPVNPFLEGVFICDCERNFTMHQLFRCYSPIPTSHFNGRPISNLKNNCLTGNSF